MAATDLPALTVELDGREVTVAVRRSARAVRLLLKIDPALGPVLVLPRRANLKDAAAFLFRQQAWLAERMAKFSERILFEAGSSIPILGIPHLISHHPDGRRGTWIEAEMLCVSGLSDHVGRRVGAFLKTRAKQVITAKAGHFGTQLGRAPGKITLRDPATRWGSCSARGDLSFSWRLIMAPEPVLSYVVAHEIAHLAEMNHSPQFWRLVGGLIGDVRQPKGWLKANGLMLHRFG